MIKYLTVLIVFLMTIGSPVAAQDFDKGYAAYEAGDYVTALQEWKPFAESGDAQAQYNVGLMYDNGRGVPQDHAEAVKWYRLAAEQGDASSQRNLGVAAQLGGGVLQDDVMAHMWFNIASANGDPIAGELRDKRAGLMTTADISKAQAMARECMSSGYTKCGY